jgi:hypothetical protein
MTLAEALATAQGGRLFEKLAGISGLTENDCQTAMAGMTSAIAARIREGAHDHRRFAELVAMLEDNGGDLLADGELGSRDTEEDGRTVLASAYGSQEAAREAAVTTARALRLDEAAVQRLMPIAAALVLAILARRHHETSDPSLPQASSDAGAGGTSQRTDATGGRGVLSIFLAALGAAVVRAIASRLSPRRRRRYGYQRRSHRTSRRSSQRSRRRRQPTLDEIFRGLLS